MSDASKLHDMYAIEILHDMRKVLERAQRLSVPEGAKSVPHGIVYPSL